jgi:hypothetical protein
MNTRSVGDEEEEKKEGGDAKRSSDIIQNYTE